jgi:uncharacterized OsmC-like protein
MYHVEIINTGASVFQARSKDSEFTIDTTGKGMTPPDALLASLGSCVGVYVRKYAEGAGLTIGEFSVTVDADLSKEAPVSLRTISVRVDLKGAQLDERRKRALLEFVKNCPIHNTLKSDPVVDIHLT